MPGKRPYYWADNHASSNWRYLTLEDSVGPRKDEIMLSTTEAKKVFALETRDIETITGFRRPGDRSTLTMYYHADLVTASVRKWGQAHFDEKVPEGRRLSGAEAREKAAQAQQAALAREANDPYAVVPAERLSNLKIYRLQAMLERYEGGKKPPWCSSKDSAVARLIAAGYSVEQEAAHVVKQRAADEAAEAARLQAIADRKAKEEARDAENARKRQETERRMEERAVQFEAGTLPIGDLNCRELQLQLKRRGCPADGGKAACLERLEAAIAKAKSDPAPMPMKALEPSPASANASTTPATSTPATSTPATSAPVVSAAATSAASASVPTKLPNDTPPAAPSAPSLLANTPLPQAATPARLPNAHAPAEAASAPGKSVGPSTAGTSSLLVKTKAATNPAAPAAASARAGDIRSFFSKKAHVE